MTNLPSVFRFFLAAVSRTAVCGFASGIGEGEGLLFYGNVILPFVDRFPTDLELYRIMTTKLTEVQEAKGA